MFVAAASSNISQLADLCLWARVLAFVFGCISLRINVVLKRLELDAKPAPIDTDRKS